MKNDKLKMILGAIIACLLWGSAFPVLKITYRELNLPSDDIQSKILLASLRFFLSGVIIFTFYLIKNKKIPLANKSNIKGLILLGIFQTTLQYIFFYTGVANTSGIKGAVLTSSGTFFVVLIAHFKYKDDKLSLNKIIGLILGFSGIIIINFSGNTENLLDISFLGEGFLLIAGLASGIGTIIAKDVSEKVNPFIMTGYQMLIGSSILFIIAILVGDFGLHFTPLALLLYIYSAFLSSTAFIIWYYLLRRYKASIVSMYKFLIPIFGTILSLLFLPNENVTIQLLLGLLFVTYGIYIVNRKSMKTMKNNY